MSYRYLCLVLVGYGKRWWSHGALILFYDQGGARNVYKVQLIDGTLYVAKILKFSVDARTFKCCSIQSYYQFTPNLICMRQTRRRSRAWPCCHSPTHVKRSADAEMDEEA